MVLIIIFPSVFFVPVSSAFSYRLWLLGLSHFYFPTLDSLSQCLHTEDPSLLFHQALLTHWGKARTRPSTTVSHQDLFRYLNLRWVVLFFSWYNVIALLTRVKILVLYKKYCQTIVPPLFFVKMSSWLNDLRLVPRKQQSIFSNHFLSLWSWIFHMCEILLCSHLTHTVLFYSSLKLCRGLDPELYPVKCTHSSIQCIALMQSGLGLPVLFMTTFSGKHWLKLASVWMLYFSPIHKVF